MQGIKLTKATFDVCVNRNAFEASNDTGTRKGWTYGPFGIHGNKYGYTLTHLASGLIAGHANKLNDMRNMIKEYSALPIKWEDTDPLRTVPENVREALRDIVRRYKQ